MSCHEVSRDGFQVFEDQRQHRIHPEHRGWGPSIPKLLTTDSAGGLCCATLALAVVRKDFVPPNLTESIGLRDSSVLGLITIRFSAIAPQMNPLKLGEHFPS